MAAKMELTIVVEGITCPVCPACGQILGLADVTEVTLSTNGTKLFFHTADNHQVSSGPAGLFIWCPTMED